MRKTHCKAKLICAVCVCVYTEHKSLKVVGVLFGKVLFFHQAAQGHREEDQKKGGDKRQGSGSGDWRDETRGR